MLSDGEDALRSLKKIGQIGWNWTAMRQSEMRPVTPPALVQEKSPDVARLVPRRIVQLEMVNRNMLPRKYWQVLLLIDGSRTTAQIAALLIPSPSQMDIQEIARILYELQRQGIISISDN